MSYRISLILTNAQDANYFHRLQDKNTPGLGRWDSKLVHEENGALYTWEGLTTPYQPKDKPKLYPSIEVTGQDW